MSLKVLAECPMNTILMFQMNKNLLSQDIPEVILLIANLIALQPSDEQKYVVLSGGERLFNEFSCFFLGLILIIKKYMLILLRHKSKRCRFWHIL
jgi:hypothetical protein